MLRDIEKDTVEWENNFDDTLKSLQFYLLDYQIFTNGTTGIAVGMAINMPPHNLTSS